MNVVLFGWFVMSVVSLGSLLYTLPADRRKSVRDLEKLSTKISKLECSLFFNKTCLREGILPNYSNWIISHIFSHPANENIISYHIAKFLNEGNPTKTLNVTGMIWGSY